MLNIKTAPAVIYRCQLPSYHSTGHVSPRWVKSTVKFHCMALEFGLEDVVENLSVSLCLPFDGQDTKKRDFPVV